jgi:hypothetical protein
MQNSNMIGGENRDPTIRARQAADALFAPKAEANGQPGFDTDQPLQARKPRVLPALPQAPSRCEAVVDAPPTSAPPAALEIPAGKVAQLRTLAKYGITAAQLAELHRVPIESIKRILRKS